MNRARVLLADDHPENAALLRELLQLEFEVVAQVDDGASLVDAAAVLSPDVIVCDISMPRMDGIEAAHTILRRDPGARIVFVSVHNEPWLVSRGLAAGAMGYVLKLSAGDDLLPAVRAALRGQRHVSGSLCRPPPPEGRQPI
jgi:DNA-binding NarL/FixJ family response regulator